MDSKPCFIPDTKMREIPVWADSEPKLSLAVFTNYLIVCLSKLVVLHTDNGEDLLYIKYTSYQRRKQIHLPILWAVYNKIFTIEVLF